MKKKKTYVQNYKYAKSLAVRWRLSKRVIVERLINKEVPVSEANRIIKRLEEEKFLDDDKAFSLDVFALEEKRYGYKRIKEKLIAKGYPQSLVSTYLFNKDIEKDNCAYYFNKGKKKYSNYRYSDSEREKLINYLKRYGFNGKIIHEVIKIGINYENVE